MSNWRRGIPGGITSRRQVASDLPPFFFLYLNIKHIYLTTLVIHTMKNIAVNDDTHAELKSWGEFGESFDDVIKKLMKCCKEAQER